MSYKALRYSVYDYPCQKKNGIIGIPLSHSYSAFRVQRKSKSSEVMAPTARDARIRPGPGRAHSSAFLDEPVGERNCDGLGLRP